MPPQMLHSFLSTYDECTLKEYNSVIWKLCEVKDTYGSTHNWQRIKKKKIKIQWVPCTSTPALVADSSASLPSWWRVATHSCRTRRPPGGPEWPSQTGVWRGMMVAEPLGALRDPEPGAARRSGSTGRGSRCPAGRPAPSGTGWRSCPGPGSASTSAGWWGRQRRGGWPPGGQRSTAVKGAGALPEHSHDCTRHPAESTTATLKQAERREANESRLFLLGPLEEWRNIPLFITVISRL